MSQQHSSTGSRTQTITAEELLGLESPLRLRLVNQTRDIIQAGHGASVEQMLERVFMAANEDQTALAGSSRLLFSNSPWPSRSRAPTAEERVKKVCERFRALLNQYEVEVLENYTTLDDEQQEVALQYYEQAMSLFGNLLAWLDQVVEFTLAKLKAGYTLDEDALKKVFGEVKKEMGELFKKPILDEK